jgi:uncharacterized membrane protein
MPTLVFTIVTALVFCIGDAVMIPLVMRPLFKAALGAQMLDTLRLGPAALFYIIHIGGLVYFAGRAFLRGGTAAGAALNGAVLGLVTYSCYEMTSFTIMRDWNTTLVIVDMAWGTVISGAAAWAGAVAANRSGHRRLDPLQVWR